MAEIYQQRIASLYESLQAEETKSEAAERPRTIVSQITLQPAAGELAISWRPAKTGSVWTAMVIH